MFVQNLGNSNMYDVGCFSCNVSSNTLVFVMKIICSILDLGSESYMQGWTYWHILVINSLALDTFICDYRSHDVTIINF